MDTIGPLAADVWALSHAASDAGNSRQPLYVGVR